MKRGRIPDRAEVQRKARGDGLSVAFDPEALEALVEATRRRCIEEPTPAAEQRYLAMVRAASVPLKLSPDFKIGFPGEK